MSIIDRIAAELLALDQSANTILGGTEDQTLSARAYAVELAGVDSFWRRAIDRLFYQGHCKQAWENEMLALAAQGRLDETKLDAVRNGEA
jgi:hypothetical protein